MVGTSTSDESDKKPNGGREEMRLLRCRLKRKFLYGNLRATGEIRRSNQL